MTPHRLIVWMTVTLSVMAGVASGAERERAGVKDRVRGAARRIAVRAGDLVKEKLDPWATSRARAARVEALRPLAQALRDIEDGPASMKWRQHADRVDLRIPFLELARADVPGRGALHFALWLRPSSFGPDLVGIPTYFPPRANLQIFWLPEGSVVGEAWPLHGTLEQAGGSLESALRKLRLRDEKLPLARMAQEAQTALAAFERDPGALKHVAEEHLAEAP